MKSRVVTISLALIALTLPLAGAAGAQPTTQSISVTLNVRALIDGRSHLIIQGNTVHWHHLDFAAPGRHEGADEPTYLNGIAWYPAWPDVPDRENRDCDCDSSSFVGVPPLAAQAQTVALGIIHARWDATIVQQPDENNGFTLIVEFDDNPPGGSDWYEIDLVYMIAPLPVAVDVKPASCPNPFNVKSNGVLPVAVLGTEDLNVMTIDPATIQLTREGYEEGVAPLRWSYEDAATPFKGELCDCHDRNGDGWLDLVLKFETQEVKDTLGLFDEGGNTVELMIIGFLKDDGRDGMPIVGKDCLWVLKKKMK